MPKKKMGWNVDYITNVLHVGSWGGELKIVKTEGRNGLEFIFPEEWARVGMKEIKIEFMELAGGLGYVKWGAIDDVEIYETVLE